MPTINQYTGKWDTAVRRKPYVRIGMDVLIHRTADAREVDGFNTHLKKCGFAGEWFACSNTYDWVKIKKVAYA
jgi:hypothetical protein